MRTAQRANHSFSCKCATQIVGPRPSRVNHAAGFDRVSLFGFYIDNIQTAYATFVEDRGRSFDVVQRQTTFGLSLSQYAHHQACVIGFCVDVSDATDQIGRRDAGREYARRVGVVILALVSPLGHAVVNLQPQHK